MSVRIMVAIHNGSPSGASMALAAGWARRLGGTIAGLGVVDESNWAPAPVLSGGVPAVHQPVDVQLARAAEYVKHSLKQLEEHCKRVGVEYHETYEVGMVGEEIVTEAQRHDVILLGRGSTPDPGLGVPAQSVLESVLRHSPRPVVVVADRVEDGRGILVAYDGSLQAARALQALVASGLCTLGDITILSLDEESAEKADEHARCAAEYLAIHGIAAECRSQITDKSVQEVIVEEAQRQGVEMLVMGAYGRSRLAEFFLGSVTSHVIDTSPLPVFLFH